MVRLFLISFLVSFSTCLVNGQANYFNVTIGNIDQFSERVNNVEVLDDYFYVFGEERYDNEKWFVRKYDFQAELQAEKYYDFDVAFLWPGTATSFKKRADNSGFYLSAEIWDSLGHWSYLMNFNLDLDTLWTKKYEYSTLHSGFDVAIESEDDLVISGNFNTDYTLGSGEGTYLSKIDSEGNELWTTLLKEEPEDAIIKNKSILNVEGGYLTGGAVFNNSGLMQDYQGYLTMIDNDGNTQWEITSEDLGLVNSWFYLLQMTNGDILCSQVVGFEEATSFNWYHFKTKVYKLNVTEQSFYWEHEYLQDDNLTGAPLIPKETIDGGVIFLGGRFGETTSSLITSLLKIDSLGNQEWYKEYVFEDCPDCFNNIIDIDVAPDGGFILSGEFFHSDELPFYKESWLLKVDACGDEEWQGCDIVGVNDVISSKDITVYPNPASNIVYYKGIDNHQNLSASIIDFQGKFIKKSNIINGTLKVDELHLINIKLSIVH